MHVYLHTGWHLKALNTVFNHRVTVRTRLVLFLNNRVPTTTVSKGHGSFQSQECASFQFGSDWRGAISYPPITAPSTAYASVPFVLPCRARRILEGMARTYLLASAGVLLGVGIHAVRRLEE
jgi:hypothetical protein